MRRNGPRSVSRSTDGGLSVDDALRLLHAGIEALRQHITGLTVCPAAEATRAALVNVLSCAITEDLPAYKAALGRLRPALADFLVGRAGKWSHDLNGKWIVGYLEWRGKTPEQAAAQTLRETKGWALAMLAGKAVQCSADELVRWASFYDGDGDRWHAHYIRSRIWTRPNCNNEPAANWAWWRGQCVLPAEETVVLVARLAARGIDIAAEVARIDALTVEPGWASSSEVVDEKLAQELDALPESAAAPEPESPAPPAPESDSDRGRWPGAADVPPTLRGFGWGEHETD